MNSHFYESDTGRFLTQDTWKGSMTEPWTQNLYSYTGNNPINLVDPTGHCPKCPVHELQYTETYKTNGICDYCGNYDGEYDVSNDFKTREDWGALPPIDGLKSIEGDPNEYYDTIVVHHTDRPEYEPMLDLQYDAFDEGYSDMPYHFIIDYRGQIYYGRDIKYMGAHVLSGNEHRLGVALQGGFHDGTFIEDTINSIQGVVACKPSDWQITALKLLLTYLDDEYGIYSVVAHTDVAEANETSCPGNTGYKILEENGIFR